MSDFFRLSWVTISVCGSVLFAMGCTDNPGEIEVVLEAQAPDTDAGRSLRWSPKGEKLFLLEDSDGLTCTLRLGPDGTPALPIRLEKGESSSIYNLLYLDRDRSGSFEDYECIETTPEEIRGRMWSSFEAVVEIPSVNPETGEQEFTPYPLSFWFVDDPQMVEEEPVLRFSRRGWMEGHVEIDGTEAVVLLTDNLMDGVYDQEDSWALACADSAANIYLPQYARSTNRHAWLLGQAYQITELSSSGRKMVLAPFDPGVTRAQEAEMDDHLAEDRRAARSGRTVDFLRDFTAAEALASSERKALFVDFETEWCGPCHVMDEWVYTADAVVNASSSYVSVKVDGDEHPELKERFLVDGYPTMLVVDSAGTVMRRNAGYMSVAEMVAFLTVAQVR